MSSEPAALGLLKLLGRFPMGVRRRVFRAGWKASLSLRKEKGFELGPAFERYLRISASEAKRLDLEHEFHDFLQIMEWFASASRSRKQMIRESAKISDSDPELMQRIAATGEPVILAPIHMGVFTYGVTYVIWKYFEGRRILILRAREDLDENNAAMDRLGELSSEVMLLNTRKESEFMDAMRFARKGAVVVSLIDLPASYGSPSDTVMFGENLSIAMGLDAMARMLKAVVVPMTTCSHLWGDRIHYGQPFEVWSSAQRDRAQLAMEIGKQVERLVRLSPEQWHMWTRFDEFFPQVNTIDSPVEGDASIEGNASVESGADQAKQSEATNEAA